MYDFIIVGGGSAGCVLANRLSKNPAHKVVLIEAGKQDKEKNIHIPAAFCKLFKSEHDWQNYTTPQEHADNRSIYMPRGKVMGGCSSINAMIYIRGHRADYDEWEKLGNKGWSFDDVLPYFKKSEQQNCEHLKREFHGKDGELSVSDLQSPNVLSHRFIKAGQELGYAHNTDFNGEEQEGVGLYQVTQKSGKRHNTAQAFIQPVRHRRNLHIITEAEVEKIIFEDKKAVGVSYIRYGKRHTIEAQKEIILSAGAFNSPQLLMLSGIGDGNDLQELGIKVIHDLKGVGKNLQDHAISGMGMHSKERVTLDIAEGWGNILFNAFDYMALGKGSFTSNIAEAGGFIKTNKRLKRADIQLVFAPSYFLNHGFDNPKGCGFSLGAVLLRPKSVGEVKLASPEAHVQPLIDPQFLRDEHDLKTMVKGLKIVDKLLNAKAFSPYRHSYYLPEVPFKSDEAIADFIRERVEHLYHPVGTCKMGHDKLAVVDDQLTVHGLKNLRVVDASIMPKIVGGNTNAPTIMIAEKAADMILKRHTQVTDFHEVLQ